MMKTAKAIVFACTRSVESFFNEVQSYVHAIWLAGFTDPVSATLHMVSRGCAEVPEDDDDYDGCRSELPQLESNDIFQALSPASSLQFDGEVCYSSGTALRRDVMTACLALMLGLMYRLML